MLPVPFKVSMDVTLAAQAGLTSEVWRAAEEAQRSAGLVEGQPLLLTDTDGTSLLHWAAISGNPALIEGLLDRALADIEAVAGELEESPLMWAVREARNAAAVACLLRRGALLERRTAREGCTALQLASRCGCVNSAYVLLTQGAEADARDAEGDTALLWLVKHPQSPENIDLVRLLLHFGAALQAQDARGDTCLHVLAGGYPGSGRVRISKMLLAAIAHYEDDKLNRVRNANDQVPSKVAIQANNYIILNFIVDLGLYSHFPYYFPMLLNASTVLAGFAGLAGYGWVGGAAAFTLSGVLVRRLDQSTIEMDSSRPVYGRVWGLVLGLTATFLWRMHAQCSRRTLLSLCAMCGLLCYTLYRTERTKPARVTPHEQRALTELICGGGGGVRLCTTCMVDKGADHAVHHCPKCDFCMSSASLDHHCPFVNNCVGQGNRRVFVFFVCSAALTCLAAFACCIAAPPAPCSADRTGGGLVTLLRCQLVSDPLMLASTWLNLCVSAFTGLLCVGQLAKVGAETTTWEVLHGRGSKRTCLTHGMRRSLANIGTFLWTGRYLVTPDPDVMGAGRPTSEMMTSLESLLAGDDNNV